MANMSFSDHEMKETKNKKKLQINSFYISFFSLVEFRRRHIRLSYRVKKEGIQTINNH